MPAQVRRQAPWGVLTMLLAVAACTSPSAAPSPSAAEPGALASAEPQGVQCAPLELQAPSGQRIDLTGAWSGGSTVHFMRQNGSCVWWEAVSNLPGDPLGTYWRNVFLGQLAPDFTLSGDWAEVFNEPRFRQSGPENGWVQFAIQIDTTSGQDEITLVRMATHGDPYRIETLHRIPMPEWPIAPETPS